MILSLASSLQNLQLFSMQTRGEFPARIAELLHRGRADAPRSRSPTVHPCPHFVTYSTSPVKRFATDVVAPKVREMDDNESMDPIIIQGLFEQGVSHSEHLPDLNFLILSSSYQLMGVETSPDFGGSGSSFSSAIITIEELAKVDPSVSVLCDVHNTLVNTVIRKYGTHEQQAQWLPQLSESKVRILSAFMGVFFNPLLLYSWAHFVSPKARLAQTLSLSKHMPRRKETTGYSTAPRCGLPTHTKLRSSSSSPTYASTRRTTLSPHSQLTYTPRLLDRPKQRV